MLAKASEKMWLVAREPALVENPETWVPLALRTATGDKALVLVPLPT